MIICDKDTTPIVIDLPDGATDISIINAIPGLTINGETGNITINWDVFRIGIYNILIGYTLGGVDFVFPFQLIVVDCTPKPIVTTYNLCVGETYNFQILFSNGNTYTNVAIPSEVTGVSVTSTGMLTIISDGIGEEPVIVGLRYGTDLTQDITINPLICLPPTEITVTECERDSIGISWVNQEGGRQSFYFNQPKEFGIAQSGGEEYKNTSREKRYYTRGEVEDAVNITQQFIPIEFVTSINSLKNSIQAWASTDINDNTTHKSIIIDEDTWIFKRTNDRYYTLSFRFRYSKSKVIQKQ
jgi:hypothetical protein